MHQELTEAFIDIGAPHFDHVLSQHSEGTFSRENEAVYFAPVSCNAGFRAFPKAASEKTGLLNQKFRGNPRKAEASQRLQIEVRRTMRPSRPGEIGMGERALGTLMGRHALADRLHDLGSRLRQIECKYTLGIRKGVEYKVLLAGDTPVESRMFQHYYFLVFT